MKINFVYWLAVISVVVLFVFSINTGIKMYFFVPVGLLIIFLGARSHLGGLNYLGVEDPEKSQIDKYIILVSGIPMIFTSEALEMVLVWTIIGMALTLVSMLTFKYK